MMCADASAWPTTDLLDPTLRRDGSTMRPCTTTTRGSVPATADCSAAAVVTVTVGPDPPPVVRPSGFVCAKPSRPQVA